MTAIKKLLAVFSAFSIVLHFVTIIIPSTLLASGKIDIENEKVSAVIAKFEQISSIPRCPGTEKNIARMLKQWSKSNDLEFKKDSKGNVLIKVQPTKGFEKKPTKAITQKDAQKIINLLKSLPNGVAAMSFEFEDNVETSNNVGLAHFKKSNFVVLSMERSADMKKIDGLQSRIQSAAKNTGAKAKIVDNWAAWEPDRDSALLQRGKQVYSTTFGKDPKIQVVHAGLECSVIAAKIPEMDMIAIGPTIENAHSANERLYIPSVENLWKFLTALLASYGQ